MPSRQANDAVVCMCERSIFSKNHDYNESIEVQLPNPRRNSHTAYSINV